MRVFTEIQKLPKWLFAIVIPVFLLVVALIARAYFTTSEEANKTELLLALMAVIFSEVIAVFFILYTKQIVRIDESGIYYSYPPFRKKKVHIPFTKIKKYDLVPYPYNYYGYHVGYWNFLRREPSITSLGLRKVLRLTFTDGRTLLIGTRKPDEMLSVLKYNLQKEV